MNSNRPPAVFLVGTRWFGILGPCRQIISALEGRGIRVFAFGQSDAHWARYHNGRTTMVRIHMRRSYTAFWWDALDVLKLIWYGWRYRPAVIHSFNPKPALLSFAAALLLPRTRLLIGVTGLGNTFIRAKRMEPLITGLLRLACRRSSYVFFQNPDDRELFTTRRLGTPAQYRMFIGPGVDLDEFPAPASGARPDDGVTRVVCVARLIWQKGIREYIEAARTLRAERGDRVEFLLVGSFDREHPDCVDEGFIADAVAAGVVRHIPWTDRLADLLATCDISVLHSYREGAPRAILEASAMRIPTIGADAIGVRELIRHQVTGLLTPLRSTEGIITALRTLIDDPATRRAYGAAAYEQIAVPYSLPKATEAQLEMYRGAID